MEPTGIPGVFKEHNKLYTENLTACRGTTVYTEKLLSVDGREFRSWIPYKSKLAATIMKGLKHLNITADSTVLYLGAATGTTVSHFSDIVTNGNIYAVESSPVAMSKLKNICTKRHNIIPILADARHPEMYSYFVPSVDLIYQDISQRNQAEIFIHNATRYLKKQGQGILIVKTRSIDVSMKPNKIYDLVANQLKEHGLHIIDIFDLSPYEKDHASIIISL